MLRPISFSLLAAFSAVLLTGCSTHLGTQASGFWPVSGDKALPNSLRKLAVLRVDSLNGIPGHTFGDPLSTFPGIELSKNQKPESQTYAYPDGKGEDGWFGARIRESSENYQTFYHFKDGKFVAFSVVSYAEGRKALEEQSLLLFGPSEQFAEGPVWKGVRARAWSTTPFKPLGPANVLQVQSQAFVNALAAEQTARLNEENAL